MKRLLVTGARGFIGRHCLAPALAAGYEIHALSTSPATDPDLRLSGVTWHTGNLLDDGRPSELVERIRPSHILHTAWVTTHPSYWMAPDNLRWLAIGARLIERFAAIGGTRFVSLGSCAEYKWGDERLVEGETAEAPSTLYGSAKLAHHIMLKGAARHLGFSAATARIFFAYGPHENENRVVPFACRQLNAGLEVPLTAGHFWRDFMYVSDAADALVALLDSDIEGACNVCSGDAVLLADIMLTLGRVSGRADLIRLGSKPHRPGDPQHLVGSNARLRSTGWRPAVTLEQGLEKTLNWWGSRG